MHLQRNFHKFIEWSVTDQTAILLIDRFIDILSLLKHKDLFHGVGFSLPVQHIWWSNFSLPIASDISDIQLPFKRLYFHSSHPQLIQKPIKLLMSDSFSNKLSPKHLEWGFTTRWHVCFHYKYCCFLACCNSYNFQICKF